MKKCFEKLRRLFRSPRLHHGGYQLLLCTGVIAALILFTVLIDIGEQRFGWQSDLSFNAISTTGETTDALLRSLDKDVHAYAVFSDGSEDNQLIALLNRYQARSDHFSWSQENLTRNPLLLQMVSDNDADASVSGDCLILYCADTGRTRVLSAEDYCEYAYSPETGSWVITGWTYEKSMTEALVYITLDELPRVQVLQGHGELTENEIAVMRSHLTASGYTMTFVNLMSDGQLNADEPLMILSPTRDITEAELRKLTAYAEAGGDLFITVDWTDPDTLPNLYAFYRLYGIEPIPGLVLADSADTGTYYESVPNLLPEMLYTDLTGVLKAGHADSVLLAGARAFETPAATGSALTTEVVLQSGPTAYIRHLTGSGANITVDFREGDRQGTFALALSAHRFFDGGKDSRAFAIGNSSLFLDDWMYTYTYSGELLLQALSTLSGGSDIRLDIVSRTAARPQLTFASAALPAVLLMLAPLIVLVLALAIYRPRRNL